MAHPGRRIGDVFSQMAADCRVEERADSDLVPEMDELPAGLHLFGIDRVGYLFLGGQCFLECIGERQTVAFACDSSGSLLFEKYDPFRHRRYCRHQPDGVGTLISLALLVRILGGLSYCG